MFTVGHAEISERSRHFTGLQQYRNAAAHCLPARAGIQNGDSLFRLARARVLLQSAVIRRGALLLEASRYLARESRLSPTGGTIVKFAQVGKHIGIVLIPPFSLRARILPCLHRALSLDARFRRAFSESKVPKQTLLRASWIERPLIINDLTNVEQDKQSHSIMRVRQSSRNR